MRARRLAFFSIGLTIGLLAGAVAALLLAPSSGAKTRRLLRRQLLQGAELARSLAEKAEWIAAALGQRMERCLGGDEERAWRRIKELREGVERYTESRPADVTAVP